MKKLYTILTVAIFTLSGTLMAQTFHSVDLTNNLFTPGQLTINVGDTVHWTNSEGFHNVNGKQTTYPNNPESFGNETGPAGWTYQFVFTVPGTYDYVCDVHPNMTASIIVEETSVGIAEAALPIEINFYPNPVQNQLSWKWDQNQTIATADMTIYDITGKKVDAFSLITNTNRDMSAFAEGLYTFLIVEENGQVQTGKILVNR